MLISTLAFMLLALLFIAVAGVLTATLLAVGTVLSRIFAVSVWEATVAMMAVAAVLLWLIFRTPTGEAEETAEEPAEEPRVWVLPDFPLPPRRGKKRKR